MVGRTSPIHDELISYEKPKRMLVTFPKMSSGKPK